MTEREIQRLKEFNEKNDKFNVDLYKNTNEYSNTLCLFSLFVVIVFILYLFVW